VFAGGSSTRYLITFACYGGHLHGDDAGSVDRSNNLPGSRLLSGDPKLAKAERQLMNQAPYLLDPDKRVIVLESLREVCSHRGWVLLAAHVRTNHAHAVVEAEEQPEKIMKDFKSYSSRNLHRAELGKPDRRNWARHGSTRWLWKDEDARGAIRYVVEQQGEPCFVELTQRP
jgi:REP element-mobilizing transposase RayT